MDTDAYVAAAIGFVTAATLALINSWLAGRENVAEEVRNQRIATYPAVWKRTSVVSRWPRTDAGRDQFLRLHEDLRRWYYAGGGLYLSTRARKGMNTSSSSSRLSCRSTPTKQRSATRR